ncbi:hypothetical protein NCH01_08290 [Neoasaia chiangmaiensis]|uniref:Uncharacterized protein n=1 Tax=Neoasaia chiangmaiensis TaxID=320497 RepID=A0A1U9KPP8_9PROT|nr:hypothetical protein A0U93_07410 [Neoasaia chiangmaiensis]GEN14398.1 hypothetical protein NCH01_08290 [Neoasaia chiangmaiensis]
MRCSLTIAVMLTAGLAMAPAASAVTRPACRLDPVSFRSPTQPLDHALRHFTDRTHCPVLIDPSLLTGRESQPLNGVFEPAQALKMLIGRNDLEFVRGQDGYLVHPVVYHPAQHMRLTD